MLIVILAVVFLINHDSSADTVNYSNLASSEDKAKVVNPLDTLSSSEVAATAAQLAHLEEANAIVNKAVSDQVQIHLIAAGDNVITKPQVIKSDYFSNKDIKSYKVKKGDTLASVANKFDLQQNTIKWSNDLASSTLKTGQTLLIPPVDGIVYTVKSGDTISSLAKKYDASKAELTAYNDAELKGIKKGERIIIPGGQKPTPVSTYSPISFFPRYGFNGYYYGECTWYVATQIKVPSNWHNANTWAYFAARTPGWNVSSVPTPGAIAQTPYSFGGYGHVAIVDSVSADGTKIKFRDMNGIAGWGRVGYSGWVPTSHFVNYITKN